MKKIIIGLFIIMVTAVFINEQENLLIPDNAIRLRIIANSNSLEDQELKLSIKDEVQSEIYKIIADVSSIEEARILLKSNINKVDEILKNYNIKYDITYGDNYFPEKEYKGIKYDEGNYESLVITLGSGVGKNWWCVLFPPLCLLDEQKNLDEVEYELYAAKLINKFK